ncbi:hypothetical protein Dda_4019 [Drechslerella dactyloides]|uniref:Arrestin C-terminal-like domain-containing protein n=1 Tax=Drechslerella dactyloides TaxID=74499 RepID=A0AAD6J0H4_DREDA|nr:hypothetical protein Dda_4019 [Drechslerella dactyloides]
MKKITLFEIRLDQDVLVLRGDPSEAHGAQLTGKIVISCTEPLNMKSLTIKIAALQTVRFSDLAHGPFGASSKLHKKENVLYSDRLVPIGEKTVLQAGNHEIPFSWILNGDAPESVEGFREANILWNMHAHLERSIYQTDAHTHKHFRVIRTLPYTALEFSQTMAVENVWPDKLEYTISTPSKAVVFGSHIPIQVRLSPLLKGLQPVKLSVALKETFELNGIRGTGSTRTILQRELDGRDDPPSDEDDGCWIWNEKIVLPRRLADCLQDCDVGNIKIRHKVRFAIQLKNPGGHISELRATLPVMFFISENYLVNDQNEVPEITTQVTSESEISAPPRYEQHKLDALFEGIDLDMYLSQANSPFTLSRTPSAENLYRLRHARGSGHNLVQASGLAPLTPLSSTSGNSSPVFGHDASTSRSSIASSGSVSGLPSILTPHGHADLVDRLQRANQRPAGSSGSLNALANSTSWTNPPSGRESPTMEHEERVSISPSSSPLLPPLDMDEMNKVPSYSTAIRAPMRNLSFETPPTYERIPSDPPSRVTSSQSLVEMLARPSLSRSSSSSSESAAAHSPTSPSRRSNDSQSPEASSPHKSPSKRTPRLFSTRWRG